MKLYKILTTTLLAILCVIALNASGQSTDAVKKANKSNDKKAKKGMLNDDDAEFIVASADARMMGMKEGKLAIAKGSTADIRDYGNLMVHDQGMLLTKIKTLAGKEHITIPENISHKKEKGREDLSKLNGKDFDEKFVKMMIIDHERDIKMFKKAMDSTDETIKSFASEYLPTIQSHLDKINAIKDTMK